MHRNFAVIIRPCYCLEAVSAAFASFCKNLKVYMCLNLLIHKYNKYFREKQHPRAFYGHVFASTGTTFPQQSRKADTLLISNNPFSEDYTGGQNIHQARKMRFPKSAFSNVVW